VCREPELREKPGAERVGRRVDRKRPTRPGDRDDRAADPKPDSPATDIDSPRSAFACCSRSALTVIGVNPVDAG
jgi:hypothetical protein